MSLPLAMLSDWHIIVLAFLVVLLFGGKKLPEVARGLGEAMREFKKASRDLHDDPQPTANKTGASADSHCTTAVTLRTEAGLRRSPVRLWFSKKNPSDEIQVVEDGGAIKTFWEHLDDLRGTVFKCLFALAITFHLALAFANRIIELITWPLRQATDHPENFLLSLNVTDSFVLSVKLAFYVGLVLAAPAILYFVGQFVLPALKPREKGLLWPGFAAGTILFIMGAAGCFVFIVPQTLRAFIAASRWLKIEPRWTIDSYIGFVTQFTLMSGLTFEIPLVMLILVRLGVLSYDTVRRGRKILLLFAFVVAAFLAPPDPLSMVLMALPLVVLFEITIWLSWFAERRRRVLLDKT